MNTSLAPVNRVARFTLRDDNVIDPASEAVLLDNIPSPGGGHNAGDLGFGKDGYLYVSVGDGYCDYAGDSGCAANNDAARDRHVLLGKILRITPSGGIPADNPGAAPTARAATSAAAPLPARGARRLGPGACAIPSASPLTLPPSEPASSSTTWASAPGRRSTSVSPARITAGTYEKVHVPGDRPWIVDPPAGNDGPDLCLPAWPGRRLCS